MQDNVTAAPATLVGDPRPTLRQGTIRAALASGTAETVTRLLTIVLSIATARALLPDEMGVLGLAVIISGIVSLIAACSETAGVIERHAATDSQHALGATIIRGLIVTVLVSVTYLCSASIAEMLGGAGDRTRLTQLLGVLLWVPVLEVATCYPRVLLQRRLDLSYVSGASLLQVIAHVGLSVGVLWLG